MCILTLVYPVSSFCDLDLDLDQMTFVYETVLDFLPKMKFLGQGFQKLGNKEDGQTDRQTHAHTDRQDRAYITAAFAGGKQICADQGRGWLVSKSPWPPHM